MAEKVAPVKHQDGREVLDLDRHITALLTWLANKLARGASAEYRKKFGVGITEWRVLALLAIEREVTANRIVEVIGLNKGATSRSLKALEARGLISIRASSSDGRTKINSLTEAGQRLHDEILPVAKDRERRLLQHLSAEEIDQLGSMLLRLHSSLPEVNQFAEDDTE
jgi:DNA-binding MarR family transcriptional regulator